MITASFRGKTLVIVLVRPALNLLLLLTTMPTVVLQQLQLLVSNHPMEALPPLHNKLHLVRDIVDVLVFWRAR